MSNFKERLIAFSELGTLFKENVDKKENKKFPEWDTVLEKTLIESHSYNSWFTIDNLKLSLKNWSNSLQENIISDWLSKYNIEDKSSKKIAIIMAGNIPAVGFHDLLCSLLLNFDCIVKLSSEDKLLIPFIVKFLESRNEKLKNKVTFESEKLKDFDGVIATGNNNSHRYFDYYFSKYPNLLRKTRHSIAVLDGKESDKDLSDLSNDIFNYFGLGCRSVSKVFIPCGYDLDLLFNAFFRHKEVVNHNKYVNNFDYNKAVYLMSKEKFIENGFIILKEESKLGSPIGCLFYEFYNDKKEITKLINNNSDSIQCVVSNINFNTNIKFGQTQCPNINDYADNNDTIKFLLKI
ncbi:acyl-CoA reductase [Flavobacteriaceae bacterium]|nr:acyl-CoA reductase [Flavobacteriaceae bacterium]MDC1460216.1 acyl-CoA reductase [Flavobacteriaceae bacterium]